MTSTPTGTTPPPPAGTIINPTLTVPSETKTAYDGAGRTSSDHPATATACSSGTPSYGYGGDHVDTTPPAGAPATTSYTDARGNTSRLLTYHGSAPSGSYDTTSYAYGRPGS